MVAGSLCQVCHHDIFADPGQNLVQAVVGLQVGEDERLIAPEFARVFVHHVQVGTDVGGQVGFVDDEEIRFDHALAGFTWDLLTLGDVDNVHRKIDEFGAEGGRQVVPSGFYEHNVEIVVASFELLAAGFVHRGGCAAGGVRAAAGFGAGNPVEGQHTVGGQEFGVFDGVDVVGDGCHRELVLQRPSDAFDQLGFSCADGSADANAYWFHGFSFTLHQTVHDMNMRAR